MSYQWWKFIHIVGVLGFVLAHGVSVFMSFKMRSETDRARIRWFKEFSGASTATMYASLLILLVGGVVTGFQGRWWGGWWIWASLVILIGEVAFMSAVTGPYYKRLMAATEVRPSGVPRTSDEELVELVRSPIPVITAVVGFGGLAVITWLMIFKPGIG